jgi:hypothetical protein
MYNEATVILLKYHTNVCIEGGKSLAVFRDVVSSFRVNKPGALMRKLRLSYELI